MACRRFPVKRADRGSDLVENHYFGVGVAVGTRKALLYRCCAIAKSFPLPRSSRESSAMPKKPGRAITLEDMQGLFHHHQRGDLRIDAFDPILNPPQSGILGMHAIEERAVVRNGEIVIRPMMYLPCLTITGWSTARKRLLFWSR